jgi:hypothetical protein
MTANGAKDQRSAEQRAEQLMERLVSDGSRLVNDGSRLLGKVFGRVREEVEDIVAEARTMNEQSRGASRR